ncbi:MAG: DUF3459 domain-containing protein, partial [Flavobacteriales bacterium]|nr:DUF3459 domain-containing protein [Flavobacteriales bacterium]
LMALLQFTVRGIPFTYYGEEIGIEKPTLPLKTGLDPLAQRYKSIPQFMVNWTGQSLNRDECRTPMQWDTTENAGFTSGTPWLPVNENFGKKNVKTESEDPNSLLSCYKQLLKTRNENVVLEKGELTLDDEHCSSKVLAFYRELESEKFLVLLNFSSNQVKLKDVSGKILFSTSRTELKEELEPFEGRILKIN